ncbi:hypothetical protein [Acinetobacter nectaris]|uniref:hypothetical protein n=1 Tax=Acinetobacter nectaris TaxID=1219382 RepID=UPI001F35CCD6|nr:hypothetical protein [Acinetobacter nectaris]MCF9046228.1 hypothetical protein [Acinetobacter nectaris]
MILVEKGLKNKLLESQKEGKKGDIAYYKIQNWINIHWIYIGGIGVLFFLLGLFLVVWVSVW